MLGFDKIITI